MELDGDQHPAFGSIARLKKAHSFMPRSLMILAGNMKFLAGNMKFSAGNMKILAENMKFLAETVRVPN